MLPDQCDQEQLNQFHNICSNTTYIAWVLSSLRAVFHKQNKLLFFFSDYSIKVEGFFPWVSFERSFPEIFVHAYVSLAGFFSWIQFEKKHICRTLNLNKFQLNNQCSEETSISLLLFMNILVE